jgi:hypothetical protein
MWATNEANVGTIGSETGRIIIDLEYSEWARISLEKDTQHAPFATTVGIYGLMMHTIMSDSETESVDLISLLKNLIEEVIQAHQLDDLNRAYLLIDKILEL